MQPVESELPRNLSAFWLLGLINNSAYVVMIAGATNISAASIGFVYLAAVLPGFLVKATGPFWFHKVPYSHRAIIIACLMAASYTTVALNTNSRGWQLLGVVFASLQGGFGEPSMLSLTAHYVSHQAITAWSSGTGFAGVFGYAWVALLHVIWGLSFKYTLLLANLTTIGWLATYFLLLESPEHRAERAKRPCTPLVIDDEIDLDLATSTFHTSNSNNDGYFENDILLTAATATATSTASIIPSEQQQLLNNRAAGKPPKTQRMTPKERIHRALALWPYTLPLMAVYFAEYSMQSGAWTAIGFPVENEEARHRFYVFANWSYQAGVFISRSSGTLWQAGRKALWIMPAAQVGFLAFFIINAVQHVWYNWGLLGPCFVTGLLGGAVYVNAFTLIAREVEPQFKEFSLGAASLADSLGIALADVAGVLIQGCLFKANSLSGADYRC